MATDTTALAEAIAEMRAAVSAVERTAHEGTPLGLRFAQAHEYKAGRALLAALEGVPERLALLDEQDAKAALESTYYWR